MSEKVSARKYRLTSIDMLRGTVLVIMALGYAIGPYFVGPNPDRPGRLLLTGAVLMLLFLALRATNLYGDPMAWAPQQSNAANIISFLNVTKYPVSLQFLLVTLGAALMLLGWFERLTGRTSDILVTFGRVSFFYYILHLYFIHVISVSIGLWQGFTLHEMAVNFLETPPKFGLTLSGVYIVWIITITAMYPACKWFAGIKARRRDWWLSYL